MSNASPIQHVSDTAYWMASYRAMESERADALFQDPLAEVLIGEHGRRISSAMRASARYSYWTLVIRTRVIDAILRQSIAEGCRTVINLGAGLDTRPYRLDLPESVQWIEVDFQDVLDMKNERLLNEKPRCTLERIGVDLSNQSERRRALSELNARIGPAVVLTEGVIPYLDEATVSDLAKDLRGLSNFQWWVTEYYSPKLYPRFQSESFKRSLGDSPFQFYPKDWFGLFESCGWVKKEERFLYDEGARLGRPFPLPWFARIIRLIVGEEKFAPHARLQAYVVLKK